MKRNILIAAFLDPQFKDLDPFVKRDHGDVVEDVKTELMKAADSTDSESDPIVICEDMNHQKQETYILIVFIFRCIL